VPLILPLANTRREKEAHIFNHEEVEEARRRNVDAVPAIAGEEKEHTKDLNTTSSAPPREAATEATEDQKQ
jgi:hypothetical protein